MKQSKLYQIISALDVDSLKRLGDFLRSPYFNRREELVYLYDLLVKPIQTGKGKGKGDAPDKEVLGRRLLGEGYTDKKFSYLLTDLVRLLERFLVLEGQAKEPVIQLDHLLSAYHELQLPLHYAATLRAAHKQLAKSPFRDADHHRHQLLIHAHENAHFDQQKRHAYDQSLQQSMDWLDSYYLSLKLKYCCEVVNRRSMLRSDYELPLFDEILAHLAQGRYEEHPSIQVYHTILLCLIESEEAGHFERLKTLLSTHAQYFDKAEARDIHLYAINYCVKKINKNEARFFRELFSIYQLVLERELLLENKQLSPWSYKNIVEVGIKIKEYEWTEDFIKKYRKKLNPDFQQNAYYYSLANLYYSTGRVKKALPELLQVGKEDVFYFTESRMLLLRIYYDLDEVEPLLSLTHSFRIYLQRNKVLSELHRKRYLNFTKFLARIANLNPGDNRKKQRLRERIEQTPDTARKRWLLERMDAN